MKGAESLVRTLVGASVDTCFANPGTTEMDIIHAFDQVEELRAILCLFEGVVTGAADGYGRVKGTPAATLLHVAPGLSNGLANLHNARKGYTPVVNLVGEYPDYHREYDPLLGADLETLATPMSGWQRVVASSDEIAQDAADAVEAALEGQVATLIIPSNTAGGDSEGPVDANPLKHRPRPDADVIDAVAGSMRGSNTVFLISGSALTEAGLKAANRIAAATGAVLLADTFSPRADRGAGRGQYGPFPGGQAQSLEALKEVDHLILCGARKPVAPIAYPGFPSIPVPDTVEITELAGPRGDAAWALEALADALGASDEGAAYEHDLPDAPSGELSPDAIGAAVARALPEGTIVSAEPTTSGGPVFGYTRTAAPHSWLGMTGGAIGMGMPVAIGAAIAAPDQKILCLQADGGGMYTNQALWTMARENLDITTVIFSNRRYKILENEYPRWGANRLGKVADSLFDLGNPDIDWTLLAKGMGVEGTRVDTAEDFTDALEAGLAEDGPRLIEAVIP